MLQDWRVRDATSEIVVEADGWLGALAVGLGAFGLEFGALGRLSCTMTDTGGILARDAATGAEFHVEPVIPGPRSPSMPPSSFPRAVEAEVSQPAVEHRVRSDDMVENLFMRLGEISSCQGIAEAAALALRIVLDLVPSDASAVLIRTRSGDGLRFRATSGPAAMQLIDTVIPLGRGIAGHVVQLGVGITIEDVRADYRHDRRLDRSTGFTTRAMLAVPVRADTGAVYGCLELLNPPQPFTDTDFELASRVAASLGSFMNSVYAGR